MMGRIALVVLSIGLCWCLAPSCCAGEASPEEEFDPSPIVDLLELVIDADAETACRCLAILTEKIQSRELSPPQVAALRPRLEGTINDILAAGPEGPLHFDAALLAASWNNPQAVGRVRAVLVATAQSDDRRLRSLRALIAAGDPALLDTVARLLPDAESNSHDFRAAVLAALGRLDAPRVADVVLAAYPGLEADLQPKAIELLTQRTAWSKSLLRSIGEKQIAPEVLNANQVRKMLAARDDELVELVTAKWGSLRTERNPERQQVIDRMRQFLRDAPGDAHRGQVVFQKVCGQCHKIHGQGQDVGPDITANGRNSFEQLLSNVFDPSLVIGAAYQARTVITVDGRVLTGLLVEDSPQRVVLKAQGGKLETIARDDVEEIHISKLSLMPEGLETQLKPRELADLFAFLVLDRPPGDPAARAIPNIAPGQQK